MVDAFDLGSGLDGLGFDALDLDVAGFDGLGFGGFGDIGGFDQTAAFLDGMELSGIDGFEGLDAGDLQLDLGLDAIGYGSDLDDILSTPDPGQLVDLHLEGAPDIDLTTGDGFAPQDLGSLSPADAIGPGPLGSPFLPEAAGGAAIAAGGALTLPQPMLLPAGLVNAPTDSYVVSFRSAKTVAKVTGWLAKKGREVIDDLGREAAANQVKKAILAVIGGAAEATT